MDSIAAAASPSVLVARSSVSAVERRIDALNSDGNPDLLLGAGIGFRGDLDPVVSFRLGVELPIWRGSGDRPFAVSARADLEAARQELREAEAVAKSRATALRADWVRADAQVTRYEDAIIPMTSLAFDAARSAYLAGRGDFSTLVEDFGLWIEARTSLARREADRFMTWAEIQALIESPALFGAETEYEGGGR
jgi:outer membrane protein TolC